MGVTRQAVLDTIRGWVGMLERTGNNDIWFADDWGITGSSWCDAFYHSGHFYAPTSPNGRLPTENMYVPYDIAWARENGQAIEIDQGGPLPGDGVFFSWDMANWPRWRAGTGDHIAFVEGWDGGDTIWTIEGNVGSPQGVYRKVRSISETVVCFWRPTVFDDDTLGVAAIPEEEDMTPEQVKDQQETLELVRWLKEHLLASDLGALPLLRNIYNSTENSDLGALPLLRNIYNSTEKTMPAAERAAANTDDTIGHLRELVQVVQHMGSGNGSAVVDVDASLRQATPDQLARLDPGKLLAALSQAFSQPKPPVVAPNDPA